MAAIADVSTPTVSRFENGEKNIQLASVLAILDALGMVERPVIEFPDKVERFDLDRDVVMFPALSAEGEISCAITGDALADHFEARGSGRRALMAAFRRQRSQIEDAARRKFMARNREPDGSILIRSADV